MVASTPETEWDADQQGWMVALAVYRAGRCPLCGGDIEECGSKSRGTWEVPLPRRCWRTDALIAAQEARTKTEHPQALLWRVVKRATGRG